MSRLDIGKAIVYSQTNKNDLNGSQVSPSYVSDNNNKMYSPRTAVTESKFLSNPKGHEGTSPTYVTMSPSVETAADETAYVKSRYSAIRAVCLYDYQARSPDDVTVACGDVIFVSSDPSVNKPDAKWLWVYAPASRRAGYLPSGYVRRPDQSTPQSPPSSPAHPVPHSPSQSTSHKPYLSPHISRDPYLSP